MRPSWTSPAGESAAGSCRSASDIRRRQRRPSLGQHIHKRADRPDGRRDLVGAKFVAKARALIVAAVPGAFAIFICVTLPNMNTDLLAASGYRSLSKIIASVALTFFAYLGFNGF